MTARSTMPSTQTYRIGELAMESGLTRDALRYYERLGLLPVPQRTAGGFRVYPPETIESIRFVKQAQLVGLTLHDIAALVKYRHHGGVKRCRQVRDLLRTKLTDVEIKLRELESFRTTLTAHLAQCERTLSDAATSQDPEAPCPVIDTLARGR